MKPHHVDRHVVMKQIDKFEDKKFVLKHFNWFCVIKIWSESFCCCCLLF